MSQGSGLVRRVHSVTGEWASEEGAPVSWVSVLVRRVNSVTGE